MINFDSLSLKALYNEIEPTLTAGRVQKVQQPSRKELLLTIRSQGKSHKLYISIDPKFPHMAVLSSKGEAYRCIEISQKPPMFTMLLRKHMEGAKIREVRQPEHERIFEIYFDSYNELGERTPLVLAIELMGKHSNIILYNYDTNVILGSAHSVGSEKSREREVAGGLPYIYPPKAQKQDLLETSPEQFYNLAKAIFDPFDVWINKQFYDISRPLASEICEFLGISVSRDNVNAIEQEKIFQFYELARKILTFEILNPSISLDNKYFSLAAINKNIGWQRCVSVNKMLDLYFGYQVYQDKLIRMKSSLVFVIKKELKKNKTKIQQHTKTLNSDQKAENYRQLGDIIMANLYKIKPGQEYVEVENPYKNNEKELISLDPSLSANANAQRYYKLYNKAKNAAKVSRELLQNLKDEENYLESVLVSINMADDISTLLEIQEEITAQGLIKQSISGKKKDKKEKIEIDFVEINGFKVYIGKNNRQNDYIVSKLSSSNDVWLHTQEIPGSHVLIKLPPEVEDVDNETLYEASKLAVQHSQAQGSSKVPVIYTRRKFLKKPPGAKPGYVTYSQEKTIFVE